MKNLHPGVFLHCFAQSATVGCTPRSVSDDEHSRSGDSSPTGCTRRKPAVALQVIFIQTRLTIHEQLQDYQVSISARKKAYLRPAKTLSELTSIFAVVAGNGASSLSVPACGTDDAGTSVRDAGMVPTSVTGNTVHMQCAVVWRIRSGSAVVA